jgi:H+/Cl- antiporter ClcA
MRAFEIVVCNAAIVIGFVGIVAGFVGWVFLETAPTSRRRDRGTAEGWSLFIAAGIVLSLILGLCVVFGARPGGAR